MECKDCKFFRLLNADRWFPSYGECRLLPPRHGAKPFWTMPDVEPGTVVGPGDQGEGALEMVDPDFPLVNRWDWCGKWERKDSPVERPKDYWK